MGTSRALSSWPNDQYVGEQCGNRFLGKRWEGLGFGCEGIASKLRGFGMAVSER